MKRKIFSPFVIRWTATIGAAVLILAGVTVGLVQTFARSMGQATLEMLSLMAVGAVVCLVVGTTGLLFGLNRLWSAGLRKNDAIPQNNIIAWIVVLAIGLPWLASGFSGQLELILFGALGARLGDQTGFKSLWTLPAAFYLLQALVLGIMVYALLLKPRRLAPGFIAAYRGGVWPLVTGGLVGLAGWLAGVFLLRITSILIPAAGGELPTYLGYLSVGSSGRINGIQILIMLGLTPLAEELFLRGYVLPEWTRAWGRGSGWIATAALSSLMAFNPVAFPVVFLFSLGLCWLAVQTEHLAPVWVAHLVFISLFIFLMPF